MIRFVRVEVDGEVRYRIYSDQFPRGDHPSGLISEAEYQKAIHTLPVSLIYSGFVEVDNPMSDGDPLT